ncbi:hypothetical protein AAKU67_000383 [Oxalobacteraceae bacterium GrIS 2.11]
MQARTKRGLQQRTKKMIESALPQSTGLIEFESKKLAALVFRFHLTEYVICRHQKLVWAESCMRDELAKWLRRLGGMAGEW